MFDATGWAAALLRASIQGGLFVVAVWVLLKCAPGLRSKAGSWLWLAVFVRFSFALVAEWKVPVLPAAALGQNADPSQAVDMEHAHWAGTLGVPVNEAPGLHSVLIALWTAGVAVCLFRAVQGHVKTVRTLALGREAGSRLQSLAAGLLPAGIRLLESDEAPAPFVTGLVHPAIVLPSGLADRLDDDELRLVFAHEAAHLRRHDVWSGLFVFACHSLFFFHPAVWLAKSEWLIERETACDRMAIEATRTPLRTYASLLLKMSAGPNRASALVPSAAPAARTLQRRIRNMNDPYKKTSRTGTIVAVALATLVALPFAFAQQSLGQSKDKQPLGHQSQLEEQDLKTVHDHLQKAVADGRLTPQQAEAKMKKFKAERSRLSALEEHLIVLSRDLDVQVRAGRITAEEAKRRFQQAVDKMNRLHGLKSKTDVGPQEKGTGSAHALPPRDRRDIQAALVKADIEKALVDIELALADGQISAAEAQAKREELKRQMDRLLRDVPPNR